MNFLTKHRLLDKALLMKALAAGFILAALVSCFPFAAAASQLPEQVIRLHVVANSNSREDQAQKLLVRDALLKEAVKWYGDSATMEEANLLLCTHMDALRAAAQSALTSPCSLKLEITDRYFPTRDYQNFSLPAGKYRTLQVTLGEGKGKNWWCVVFPSLCLPAAQSQEQPLSGLSQPQKELVENPEKYHVKFKVVEWYEKLRELLD